MEKFIPYEKLSKKERRRLDSKARSTWAFSPVTRKKESAKQYKRQKAGRYDGYDLLFIFC